MAATQPLRLVPEWDRRFTSMCAVSAVAHATVAVGLLVLAGSGGPRPLPLVAYTVEITDPSALGGRLPPGALGRPLTPRAVTPPPAAARSPEPTRESPPPEAAPKPTPLKPPSETVALDKPTPKKPVEPRKPAEQKAAPVTKPPSKPAAETPPPAPKAAESSAPAASRPAAVEPPPGGPRAATRRAGAGEDAPVADAYAAAAARWRERAGKSGGGLGGTEDGSGPIGAGGTGPGGGGQLVGLEFLAYRQQVIGAIKSRWANAVLRPGLVAAVRFQIAPDGRVSDVRIEQSSGHPAYDGSALRAVHQADPLPAPPARYARDFREFLIEFHSEERGGEGG